MRSLRRGLRILLLAIPVLGIAAAAGAQTLTADINGDGLRDRIEAHRAPTELIVRLSNRESPQHLKLSGALVQVLVADIDADGDSDLVATTAGPRHVRVFVWTNAGKGKLVSRAPKPRDSLKCKRLGHTHRRLTSPDRPFPDEDLCGDAPGLLVFTANGLHGRPMASEPLYTADEPLLPRLRYDRRSPRGPPVTLFRS